ncbi:uncharacterized protein H6S33_006408 [Morchella sextelata]|uniref:uncharacterized protein n=1 Tax=Morchella sextelata TaxID=1174677 RepID=UPI001D03FBC9|nr:uncharacterized protein H6S33_006408 [Morchella sextelata]KAH0604740.1 hypothetical protein H6S33_006408 [Morchella sextelata]
MEPNMHRGPSNLPTPPPDSITEEERSKPGLKFDSGMDIDFQSDSLHSPVSSAQPPVSQLESTTSTTTTTQTDFKEEMKDDSEWRKPSVDDFDFMTTLGTGTFARVWLVKPRSVPNSGEAPLFALKQLKKSDSKGAKFSKFSGYARERLQFLYLEADLEYSPGGEIFGYLRRARRFDFATTQFYAAEIAMILVFLHSHGIVYRDLKPENILLDARGHVKLVDFGFAKVVGDRETYTLCGTPEYLSPEVIQSKGHGKAVDWWALGVLIYEMSCGFPPFYDNSPFAIYEKIVAGRISFPSLVPEETKDIVRKLCTKDLSARLGNMRGGGHQVMAHRFFDGIDWQELESQVNPGPIIPHLRFAGDTRYFDHYEPPAPTTDDEYPKEMMEKYDIQFRDF